MIKNIIFDIGNVILNWNPGGVVSRLFSEHPNPQELTQQLFKGELWLELNRGKITEEEAISNYQKIFGIEKTQLTELMHSIKESLLPIENSLNLLKKLHDAKYRLFALTDNVHEIMRYLKNKYDFWDKFHGIVVSAEVGYLKPSPEIYQHLLDEYKLNPRESVFIDDLLQNVEGARAMGMQAIQFITTDQCSNEMKKMQISF